MKIPFKKINLGESLEAIKPLIESGYIGLGEIVYEFERELAQFVGAKEVVAVDSCTSALFLSLIWENKKGRIKHPIQIPSMTVPLVACAIHEAGLNFTFTSATGWVGSMYRLGGTHVLDSAHQLERNQYDRLAESDLDKICFSFYPTKTIGSADGGAIATNDVEFAEWARKVITYGRNQGKHAGGNSWDYDVEMFGYKRHWTNLQAAIALEQLRRLDDTTYKRTLVKATYDVHFNRTTKSDYLYRVEVKNRDQFIKFMADRRIECGVHFKPLNLMTPFKEIPMDEVDKKTVERDYEHTASLPFFDTMTLEEVHYVIKAVQESEMLL